MNSQYNLFPISTAILLLYALSRWLAHQEIISRKQHNYLWNLVLLVFFLAASTLGVLLVINLQYKLDIHWIKDVLQIHVSAGIGLSLVGLLHLVARWAQLLKSPSTKTAPEAVSEQKLVPEVVGKTQVLAAFILGFVGVNTQLLLLRQFLDLFGSTELILGVVLASWMLYTALGSWAGTRSHKPIHSLSSQFFLLGLLPVLTLSCSYLLKPLFFSEGQQGSPGGIFLFCFSFLPVCFITGFLFSSLSKLAEESKGSASSRVYIIESLGFAFGGLAFTACAYASLPGLILSAILFPLSCCVFWNKKFLTQKIQNSAQFLFLPSILLILIICLKPDRFFTQALLPDQEVVKSQETPSGRLSITRKDAQLNLWSGGIPLYSAGNKMVCEELVHFTMVQSSHLKKVLLISGDPQNLMSELRKHSVQEVTYLSLNPFFLSFLPDSMLSPPFENVRFPETEAWQYLREDSDRFDAALLSLPAPTNALLNKYFSSEFVSLLKNRLSKPGVVCWSLPMSVNYQSKSMREVNSSLYATLRESFKHVLVIPGSQLYFVASDSALSLSITGELSRRGIQSDFVNSYYIDDGLLLQQNQELMSRISDGNTPNSIWHPLTYYYALGGWMEQYRLGYYFWLVLLSLVLLPFLFSPSKPIRDLFLIGFSAAALEYLLFLAYQLVFGNLAAAAGFLLSFYMLGTASGAWLGNKLPSQPRWWTTGLMLSLLFCVLIPAGIVESGMLNWERTWILVFLSILLWLVAMLAGIMYTLALKIYKLQSGKLYSADLIGAAAGMFIASILLFPWLGLPDSGLGLAAIAIAFLLIPLVHFSK